MHKSKPHSFLTYLTLFSIVLLGCNSDGPASARSLFKCCTEEINENVNNLPNPPDGEPKEDIRVSTVITSNGDGLNDFFTIENLHLYPNNIVEIYDSNDRLIFSEEGYHVNNVIFPSSDVSQGTYRYKIVIESEDVFLLQGYFCVVKEFPNNFQSSLGCQTLYPDPIIN